MVDHSQQKLTTREMVRAHAYPVLAAVSSLSLLSIMVLLIPQAVKPIATTAASTYRSPYGPASIPREAQLPAR